MADLFFANEQESFTTTGSQPTRQTTGAYFDSSMSKGAIHLTDATDLQADFDSVTEAWVHTHSRIEATNGAVNGNNTIIRQGTTEIVRLAQISSKATGVHFQYYNGSAWVDIQLSVAADDTLKRYDIHSKIDASAGFFDLYIDKVLVVSFSGDTTQSGASAVDNAVFSGCDGSQDHFLSEVAIKTTSTLSARVETLRVDGDGVNTDGTGSYQDLDDNIANDDTTIVTLAANNDESSYTIESSTTPSNTSISALAVASRSSVGTSGVQNLQLTTVVSGVSYPSSNVSGIDLSLRPFQSILPINPHTGLNWDDAAIVGTEIGLKAIT